MLPATKIFYDELVDLSNGIELQSNTTAMLENTQTNLADYKQQLLNGSDLHSMEANLIEKHREITSKLTTWFSLNTAAAQSSKEFPEVAKVKLLDISTGLTSIVQTFNKKWLVDGRQVFACADWKALDLTLVNGCAASHVVATTCCDMVATTFKSFKDHMMSHVHRMEHEQDGFKNLVPELKFRSALLKAMELRLAFAADDNHLVAASSQLRDLVEKFDVDAMKAAMARSLPDVIGFQEAIQEASTAYASATEANWDTELAGFAEGLLTSTMNIWWQDSPELFLPSPTEAEALGALGAMSSTNLTMHRAKRTRLLHMAALQNNVGDALLISVLDGLQELRVLGADLSLCEHQRVAVKTDATPEEVMSQGLPVDVKSLSSYAKFKQAFDDFVKAEEEKRSEFDRLVQEEQAGVQFALPAGSAFAPLQDLRRFEEHHALALAKHWHDLTLTCISVFNGIIPEWEPFVLESYNSEEIDNTLLKNPRRPICS